nr:gastrula zinc finger protein XlCGF57.1 isoform X3 [Parasteatoda tepidariorum]XP_015926346.1 gastrula zinc finger protein XlCGF57.1 isoform X3 [Parasteatoda tepidariorum]XP_015926347.1 gastrula zinc finger protein XlCGF57.1 isoform X3 [Parasteatoda tepidariorum]XP_015926348.1 gastrula zinc finger protein XlCGF57.1 isoform X3 [Parasteatoda tepidariorum]XP_042901220.1 gastrula zinc finger protein XlCGF57.1 isoform X3 [Parasteatoda tepidariorum]XP_042901221.1 gastrula zinc finger protein XlCGF5
MDVLEAIQPNQLILPHDENLEMVPSMQLDYNEEYVCEFCQKSFKRKSYLVSHIRTHTGDKPFKCRFCPKAFASQSNLMRHICIHTGDHQSGSYFLSNNPLSERVKIYMEPKRISEVQPLVNPSQKINQVNRSPSFKQSVNSAVQLQCPFCPKHFIYESKLARHIVVHTGDRPFMCHYCSKSFTQKAHLKTHLIVHLNTT